MNKWICVSELVMIIFVLLELSHRMVGKGAQFSLEQVQ